MTVRNGKLLSKTVLISALFLCSCIHEEIPEDENFIVPLKYTQETDNEKIKAFNEMCRKCVTGNADNADEVITTYNSTLKADDFEKHNTYIIKKDPELDNYFYQTEHLNSEYERCMQKAINDGRKEFAFLYVTKPRTLARLSCHFYREGNHKEGAFWLRRLENLSGRNRAYFVAAREFIKYKETRTIAAELLGEATKLGNPNSTEMLEQYIQPNNVFTEYQKKHEMATDEK